MGDCNNFTKPLAGSVQLTVPAGTVKTLAELITLQGATRRIFLTFEKDTADTSEPQNPIILGRYWETGDVPTALLGHPITTLEALPFSLDQATGLQFFAIANDMKFNITEYEKELTV